jgi:predicted Rossmann-fold nucleotide-binding protein
MGVLADSVLVSGGQAIGVMPRSLVEKEIAPHCPDSMARRRVHART